MINKNSPKGPSATLSGNFDPHVPVSTLRSKFPCRLASGSFDEFSNDYQRLLTYALFILSKKRYTCLEVQKKLKQFLKKHRLDDAEASDRVIERLKELNYLNDQQYAQDYVSDRIKFRPRGKFLLKRELNLKGIAPEITMAILSHIDVDEFEMALELLKKKRFNLVEEETANGKQKEKARAFRFLASKGFNKEIIYKAVQSQYNRV
ncbi:MAG: regulatory protein RecX [Candidatus Gracilibacteria bacterium]|jgi:regulatory protein